MKLLKTGLEKMDMERKEECMAITAKEFFDIWKEVCGENETEKELLEAWKPNSVKSYTEKVLGRNNQDSVLMKVLNKLKEKGDYDIHQEYYACDAVFYNKKEHLISNVPDGFGKKRNRGLNAVWLKGIAIHFEHENDINFSWQEITQLLVIPGKELNVLVTYPEFSITNNTEKEKELLQNYEKLLNLEDEEETENETESQNPKILLIFGYKEKVNDKDKIIWHGFYYTGKENWQSFL